MKVKDASEIRRVETNKPVESKRSAARETAGTSDKVTTEASAKVEAAISSAQTALGATRTVRLEAIEAAIRQGTFKPDPQRIAERILEDAELTAALRSMLKK
jgi:negative regulator of flagellin synthesis FlgM